jgi:hypothetical protein
MGDWDPIFPEPFLAGILLAFGIAIEEGLFDIKEVVLNEMFPGVKPMSVDVLFRPFGVINEDFSCGVD